MSNKSSFEQLMSHDRRLQVFNDTVPAGIMVLRVDDGSVVFTNRYFNDKLGHDGGEILGANWADFFADADDRQKLMVEFVEKKVVRGREIQLKRPDGEIIWSLVSMSEIPIEEESLLLFAFTDITPWKHTEAALISAKEKADLASRGKSEFLANMSHDLRTPLSAIIGFSDVMKGEVFGPLGDPKYLEYVNDINASGIHLLALINDILDLSKIEAGKSELHEENVDVSRILKSSLSLIKARAETGGVAIEIDAASDLPAIYADERKLKQILINLLSNAVKFTADGGTVFIRIWCRPEDGYVFQVADTGIGIALHDIPKALAPFSQIDSDINRKFEGTGLGLSLTKSLVELHGGSLNLQSEVDVGTTVTVRFPAERIITTPG